MSASGGRGLDDTYAAQASITGNADKMSQHLETFLINCEVPH